MNTILDNLNKARAVIAATPESTLNLEHFRSRCGTVACIAGHLCEHPHFAQFMGLEWAVGSWGLRSRLPDGSLVPMLYFSELGAHFGHNAHQNLFPMRDFGSFDGGYPGGYEDGSEGVPDSATDKELALWRIDQQIAAINLSHPQGEQA